MQTDVVVEADDIVGDVPAGFVVMGVLLLSLFRLRKKRSITALSQPLPLRLMLACKP